MSNRRAFLKKAGIGAALLSLPAVGYNRNAAADPIAAPFRLGVASYSLRKLDRAAVIAAMNQFRTPYLCLKSFHMPYELTEDQFAEYRKAYADAGIQIVGGGTITIDQDNDEHVRQWFEYARKAGMPLMVIATKPEILPRIERFVQEYNIKVAIHNHGPEDKIFPAPGDALKYIKAMDPRVGLCVDCGHTVRTGTDIVAAIKEAGPRVLDVHIKDLKDLRDEHSQCNVGHGAMPVEAIFRQLHAQGYSGMVNLEYEINEENPVPGMIESFAFLRGVLAGMRLA